MREKKVQISDDQQDIILFLLEQLSVSGGMSLVTIQERKKDVDPAIIKDSLDCFTKLDWISNANDGAYRFNVNSYHKLNKIYDKKLKKRKSRKEMDELVKEAKHNFVQALSTGTAKLLIPYLLGVLTTKFTVVIGWFKAYLT